MGIATTNAYELFVKNKGNHIHSIQYFWMCDSTKVTSNFPQTKFNRMTLISSEEYKKKPIRRTVRIVSAWHQSNTLTLTWLSVLFHALHTTDEVVKHTAFPRSYMSCGYLTQKWIKNLLRPSTRARGMNPSNKNNKRSKQGSHFTLTADNFQDLFIYFLRHPASTYALNVAYYAREMEDLTNKNRQQLSLGGTLARLCRCLPACLPAAFHVSHEMMIMLARIWMSGVNHGR